MALSEHGGEVAHVDVEVDLGGEKRGVAQEFLDGADGGAAVEKMGGMRCGVARSPARFPASTTSCVRCFSVIGVPFPVRKSAPSAEGLSWWR